MKIKILFVNPPDNFEIYQNLGACSKIVRKILGDSEVQIVPEIIRGDPLPQIKGIEEELIVVHFHGAGWKEFPHIKAELISLYEAISKKAMSKIITVAFDKSDKIFLYWIIYSVHDGMIKWTDEIYINPKNVLTFS